jgi:hypothetical protein
VTTSVFHSTQHTLFSMPKIIVLPVSLPHIAQSVSHNRLLLRFLALDVNSLPRSSGRPPAASCLFDAPRHPRSNGAPLALWLGGACVITATFQLFGPEEPCCSVKRTCPFASFCLLAVSCLYVCLPSLASCIISRG